MKNKTRKTLKNIIYGTSIVVLGSLLSMKNADGQMTKIPHPNMRAIEREMREITKPNALYAGVSYNQLRRILGEGYGVGYSRKITRDLGLYSFLSKGKYMSPLSEYTDDFKNSHVDYFKISLGIMTHDNKHGTFFTLGPAYSFLNKKDYTLETIDKKAFRKLSFEFGGGGYLGEREHLGLSVGFDPRKIEGRVNLFLQFGH